MKTILIPLFLFFISCENIQTKEQSIVRTSISILPYNESSDCFRNEKRASLSEEEVQLVNHFLIKGVEKYNDTLDLNVFNKQYTPLINSVGEKEVWITCFCDSTANDWKTTPILPIDNDSDDCYFMMKVNLTLMKSYDIVKR